MKLSKTALLKKAPSITGFDGVDTPQIVWEEFGHRGSVVPKEYKILYADYTYEDYSGDAYVLGYDKEKKQLFEVHGSHCSCYGLEDQWEPEYYEDAKVLFTAIEKRLLAAEEDSDWPSYRGAYSSKEFKAWLLG